MEVIIGNNDSITIVTREAGVQLELLDMETGIIKDPEVEDGEIVTTAGRVEAPLADTEISATAEVRVI